jgi:4a-hydroxytetrahydrobiopterin dehydratase
MANKPTAESLSQKQCGPCTADASQMSATEVKDLLGRLNGWEHDANTIRKRYKFQDFYRTMAFVNAVAWIANRENHHPDLEVGYNHCVVRYHTHAIGGLSENDFICAAKVDDLGAD